MDNKGKEEEKKGPPSPTKQMGAFCSSGWITEVEKSKPREEEPLVEYIPITNVIITPSDTWKLDVDRAKKTTQSLDGSERDFDKVILPSTAMIPGPPQKDLSPSDPVYLERKKRQELDLKRLARYSVKIQDPIGFTPEGDVLTNPQGKSLGMTALGGNNPTIYFKDEDLKAKKGERDLIKKKEPPREEPRREEENKGNTLEGSELEGILGQTAAPVDDLLDGSDEDVFVSVQERQVSAGEAEDA